MSADRMVLARPYRSDARDKLQVALGIGRLLDISDQIVGEGEEDGRRSGGGLLGWSGGGSGGGSRRAMRDRMEVETGGGDAGHRHGKMTGLAAGGVVVDGGQLHVLA
jgi:hypothetical protein